MDRPPPPACAIPSSDYQAWSPSLRRNRKGNLLPRRLRRARRIFWVKRLDAKGQWTDGRGLHALSPLPIASLESRDGVAVPPINFPISSVSSVSSVRCPSSDTKLRVQRWRGRSTRPISQYPPCPPSRSVPSVRCPSSDTKPGFQGWRGRSTKPISQYPPCPPSPSVR